MTRQHELLIDGNLYGITVSDEREALLTAKAVGRAFVAVGDEMFSGISVEYAVESFEAVDEKYLERVLRRHLGLPWNIIESDRVLIRELTPEDYKFVSKEENAFSDEEQYLAYLNSQYRFYEKSGKRNRGRFCFTIRTRIPYIRSISPKWICRGSM